jgi:putative acetyltransferase
MTTSITIRRENSTDVPSIDAVTREAFCTAPYSSQTEHLIVEKLRQSGALTISLVAESAGAVVGHIAFSPVTIAHQTTNWFGLGPLSVAPPRQGQGIGAALVRAGLEILQKIEAGGCVVLGEPSFYERFGFHRMDQLILPGVPAECFLALRLSGELPSGEVTYHPAFDVVANQT